MVAMSDEYETAKKAFEEEGERKRLALQSREQLRTLVILFALWAVTASALYWLFQ